MKKLKEQLSSILHDLTDVENDENEDEFGNEEYDYEDEPEECPEGFHWCSVKKMCVKTEEMDESIPELGGNVMDENKIMGIINKKLDECTAQTNALQNAPDEKPAGMMKKLKKDIGGLSEIVRLLREKGEYRQFFQATLHKYGANSPRELDPEKRKEFFSAVNSAWKSKAEQKVEAGIQDDDVQKALGLKQELELIVSGYNRLKEEGGYEVYYQNMLSKWGVKTPEELPEDKKKEFFDAVKSGAAPENIGESYLSEGPIGSIMGMVVFTPVGWALWRTATGVLSKKRRQCGMFRINTQRDKCLERYTIMKYEKMKEVMNSELSRCEKAKDPNKCRIKIQNAIEKVSRKIKEKTQRYNMRWGKDVKEAAELSVQDFGPNVDRSGAPARGRAAFAAEKGIEEQAAVERDPWGPDVAKQDPDRFKKAEFRQNVLDRKMAYAKAFPPPAKPTPTKVSPAQVASTQATQARKAELMKQRKPE